MSIDEHGATGAALAGAVLHERLERVRRRQDDVDGELGPEPVHQLRVALRRLQAALCVFRPILRFPGSIRPGQLRRLERRLGRLRDIDVMEEFLAALRSNPRTPVELQTLERLGDDLGEARQEAAERARTALRRPSYRETVAALSDWLEQPRARAAAALPIAALAPDLLLPSLSTVLLHPGWLAVQSSPGTDATMRELHSLRRRVKELRYQVECLEGCYGDGVAVWREELHAMQDALGRHHDAQQLATRLHRLRTPVSLLATVRDSGARALESWPAWRDAYLDPAYRAELRGLLARTAPSACGAAAT